MFRNDGFGIVLGTQHVAVTLAHPSPVQIFRLWQVYIDNVNCLLKLHHVPTFQSQLLEAASDLANVTKEMEAVMFGIYLMAINSLEESEIVEMFASTKRQLLLHYHGAMQQALTNAGFLHQPHILTLQAYVLDLVRTTSIQLHYVNALKLCSSLPRPKWTRVKFSTCLAWQFALRNKWVFIWMSLVLGRLRQSRGAGCGGQSYTTTVG